MWMVIITLFATSLSVPPAKGSIHFYVTNMEECYKIKENLQKTWSSDRYRAHASCTFVNR
jgi:hypothetical protein